MSFIDQIKQRAKNEIKTIVLPEATDVRILEAAEMVKNEGYAKVILVILSVILTLIGGLIPSKQAAKKDPVLALRTE